MEEGKLRRVEESIRVFVRVADPKYRQVVPMRFFNLTLTTPEAEAYNASFLEEKSPRADVARTLIRLVSCVARVNTELEELKRSQSMSSLWKLHADALVVLKPAPSGGVRRSPPPPPPPPVRNAPDPGSPPTGRPAIVTALYLAPAEKGTP